MTGEMLSIDQDGNDSNGDSWEVHAAIAKALRGTLQPFDVYQGPYVVLGPDRRIGTDPYAVPAQRLGVVRLWVSTDDGALGRVYREDTDALSEPFPLNFTEEAIEAALSLL